MSAVFIGEIKEMQKFSAVDDPKQLFKKKKFELKVKHPKHLLVRGGVFKVLEVTVSRRVKLL